MKTYRAEPDRAQRDGRLTREIAEDNGWTESPSGWWWREIVDGETIVNGERVRTFMGSGPYLFADDAEDCLIADGIL